MFKHLSILAALAAFGIGAAHAEQREAILQKVEVPNAGFDIVLVMTKPGGPNLDLRSQPDPHVLYLMGGELVQAYTGELNAGLPPQRKRHSGCRTGAVSPARILPRRQHGHCGASVVTALDAVATERGTRQCPNPNRHETGHAGSWFPGEHEPIIDRDLFEKVQHLLKANSEGRRGRRYQNGALLTGLIFDDQGNRMSPSFTVKHGVRYRYYVSSPLVRGQKTKAGAVSRVAAPAIEAEITRLVRVRIENSDEDSPTPTRELIEKIVDRVTIKNNRIIVNLRADPAPVEIPWSTESKGNLARIEHEPIADRGNSPDPRLVQAIVRAHSWLQALSDGTYESVEQLAHAVDLHPKVVRNRIRLAFLAPDIVRKLLHNPAASHPKLDRLEITAQLAWSEQIRVLHATVGTPSIVGLGGV
jgi:hypothetical protein